MRTRARILLSCGVLLQAGAAGAVPPLVIGDVPTADPGGVEVYLGTRYEKDGAAGWQVPFAEVVLGVSRWQEVTLEIPWLSQDGQRGIGDAVLGTKLLLLPETAERPGLAGSFEWKLATGSQSKGLGSGSMEYDFRVRSQKAWGWFTLLANVGYTVVSSPRVGGGVLERRDVGFAALGEEIELTAGLRLLADAYWRSADVPGEPARLAADLGFKCGVVQHLSVHAAAGTSLRRDGRGGPPVRAYAGVKGDFAAF